MNPLAILLGATGGWLAAGLMDKSPLFRGVIALAGAYTANAIASVPPAQAQTTISGSTPTPASTPASSAGSQAVSSDSLNPQNIVANTSDEGGGGTTF